MNYQVKIENFKDPIDYPLFFIQRARQSIYDIPIRNISNKFLELFVLEKNENLPKLKESSDLIGDNQNPYLFVHNHAFK